MNTERESGYYWVKSDDGWIIAEYFSSTNAITPAWYMTGEEYLLTDNDWELIDEIRIVREPRKRIN